MHLDAALVLFWSSLWISAAAVALFLWLMRDQSGDERRKTEDD